MGAAAKPRARRRRAHTPGAIDLIAAGCVVEEVVPRGCGADEQEPSVRYWVRIGPYEGVCDDAQAAIRAARKVLKGLLTRD